MSRGAGPVRWIYPIAGGLIAEGATIASIALVIALAGHGGAGEREAGAAAQRIRAVMDATVGSLSCYVMGWWAARRAGARFDLHGGLCGTTAAILTGTWAILGSPGPPGTYAVAVLMKILAGSAGGRMAGRMAQRSGA